MLRSIQAFWIVIVMTAFSGAPAHCQQKGQPADQQAIANSRFESLRERLLHRRVQVLEREISFVQQRIAKVPARMQLEFATLDPRGISEEVKTAVEAAFQDRETRLRRRLTLAERQLEVAGARLAVWQARQVGILPHVTCGKSNVVALEKDKVK